MCYEFEWQQDRRAEEEKRRRAEEERRARDERARDPAPAKPKDTSTVPARGRSASRRTRAARRSTPGFPSARVRAAPRLPSSETRTSQTSARSGIT